MLLNLDFSGNQLQGKTKRERTLSIKRDLRNTAMNYTVSISYLDPHSKILDKIQTLRKSKYRLSKESYILRYILKYLWKMIRFHKFVSKLSWGKNGYDYTWNKIGRELTIVDIWVMATLWGEGGVCSLLLHLFEISINIWKS